MNPNQPPHYFPHINMYSQQISNSVLYPAQKQKQSTQIYTQVYYNLNKNFKVIDLKELCKKLFLQKQGRRSQLIEQLATFLTQNKDSLALKTNLTEKQRETLFAPTPSPAMNFINSHVSSLVPANHSLHSSSYNGAASALRNAELLTRPSPPLFPFNQTYILKQLKTENIQKTCRDSYSSLYNKPPLALQYPNSIYQCICGTQNPIRGGSVFRLQCRLCKNYSHSHCYGLSPPQAPEHSEFQCALCVAARINPLLLPVFKEPGSNDLFHFLCFKPHKDANASRLSNLNKKNFKLSPRLLTEFQRDHLVVHIRIIRIGPRTTCFPKLAPELEDCYELDTPWNFSFTINNQKYESKTEPAQYVKKRHYELHDFSNELTQDNKFEFRYWPFFQNESDRVPKDDFDYAVVVMLFVKVP